MAQVQFMRSRLRLGDSAPDVAVCDPAGEMLRLSLLWRRAPLVLSFLRHFGCPFCQRALAQLARDMDAFCQRGAQVAAVTMAEPEEADAFCSARAPGVLCLSDPSRRAFRAFGLGRVGSRELLRPEVMLEGMRATLEGHLPGVPVGDMFQMPGTFVIDRDGRVRLAYYSRTVADHPDTALILVALQST